MSTRQLKSCLNTNRQTLFQYLNSNTTSLTFRHFSKEETSTVPITLVSTPLELRDLYNQLDLDLLVAYLGLIDNLQHRPLELAHFFSTPGPHFIIVFLIDEKISVNNQIFSRTLVIDSPLPLIAPLFLTTPPETVQVTFMPQQFFMDQKNRFQMQPKLDYIRNSKIVFIGDRTLLEALLYDSSCLWTTKILSALYYLFPHVRSYFGSRFMISTSGSSSVFARIFASGRTKECQVQRFLIGLTLTLLGAADEDTKKLLKGFLRQIFEAFGVIEAPDAEVVLCLNTINCLGSLVDPDIYEALERVICLNKRGEFEFNLNEKDLMDLDTYEKKFGVEKLSLEFLKMARKAYRGHKMDLLNLGGLIFPYFERYFTGFGECWVQEVINFDKIASKLASHPFAKLAAKIPDNYRFEQFPRVILAGLELHIKEKGGQIPTKMELDYAFLSKSVPLEDRERLKSFINIIPSSQIRTVIEILANVGVAEAEAILADRSTIVKEKIFLEIQASGKRGPWFERQRQKRASKVESNVSNSFPKPILSFKKEMDEGNDFMRYPKQLFH